MRVLNNFISHTLIASDGVSLYYETDNLPSDLPAQVLIHGMGGDLVAWDTIRMIVQTLGFRTVALDLRGHGLSGRPKKRTSYTIQRFAADVQEVIQQEKLTDYIVVGHCFGGMITLSVEHYFPKHSKGIILIDTSFEAPWFLQPIVKHSSLRRLLQHAGNIPINIGLFRHADSQKYVGGRDFDFFRFSSDLLHTSLRSYLLVSDTIVSFKGSEIIETLTIPTLILEGEKDSIYPPSVAHTLARMIPQAELSFIPQANHIVVLNNPGVVAEKIISFGQKIFKKRPVGISGRRNSTSGVFSYSLE